VIDRGRYAAPDAHQPRRRLRGRRLRRHLPPTSRRNLPATRHHAHKQGRVAGENTLGATCEFAGSLGTQVVKVFNLVAARTGLRDHEATAAGFHPVSVTSQADDHKAYYPGSHPITMRYTGDHRTGRLLGVQLVGHLLSEIAKRIDMPATAIHNQMTIDAISDLDLSYTPPLGSPWEALQAGAQAWARQTATKPTPNVAFKA
jgi:NADPH-dependent 2,4-dienoyl-CoA reductase/sulfur reductase-like enzyme